MLASQSPGGINHIPSFIGIPEQFRKASNEWNILAYHIYEYGTEGVTLRAREGAKVEQGWDKVLALYNTPDLADFYKMALVAWLMWSIFDKFTIETDD